MTSTCVIRTQASFLLLTAVLFGNLVTAGSSVSNSRTSSHRQFAESRRDAHLRQQQQQPGGTAGNSAPEQFGHDRARDVAVRTTGTKSSANGVGSSGDGGIVNSRHRVTVASGADPGCRCEAAVRELQGSVTKLTETQAEYGRGLHAVYDIAETLRRDVDFLGSVYELNTMEVFKSV
jgi:hypothetical protein